MSPFHAVACCHLWRGGLPANETPLLLLLCYKASVLQGPGGTGRSASGGADTCLAISQSAKETRAGKKGAGRKEEEKQFLEENKPIGYISVK